jgi:hypothetical protein
MGVRFNLVAWGTVDVEHSFQDRAGQNRQLTTEIERQRKSLTSSERARVEVCRGGHVVCRQKVTHDLWAYTPSELGHMLRAHDRLLWFGLIRVCLSSKRDEKRLSLSIISLLFQFTL